MPYLESFKSYLQNNSSYKVAHLAKIELSYSTKENPAYYYVTDANVDITWGGNTYAKGKLSTLGTIKFSDEITSYTIDINLAGEDSVELSRALADSNSSSYIGKSIQILKAYLDTNDVIIPADSATNGPELYFEGIIQSLKIKDVPNGSSLISWTIANHWTGFNKNSGRITSDSTHRALDRNNNTVRSALRHPSFEDDYGFQHAGSSGVKTVKYQKIEERSEIRYKRKSIRTLGIKTGSYQEPYTYTWHEWVTHSIELNLQLNEKYLPIVYGTKPVKGIPVFADVLQPFLPAQEGTDYFYRGNLAVSDTRKPYETILNSVNILGNKTFLCVVYALCEGMVDGLVNIHVDGEPIICLNDTEQEGNEDGSGRACFGNIERYGTTLRGVALGTGLSNFNNTPLTHGSVIEITDENDLVTNLTFFDGRFTQEASRFLVGCVENDMLGAQPEGSMDDPDVYWGLNHRLSGTAYVMALVELNEDRDSLPEFDFVVSGYNTQGSVDTTDYSEEHPFWYVTNQDYSKQYNLTYNESLLNLPNGRTLKRHNPVAHLWDYLTSPIYGLNVDPSEIDLDSFVNVAQYMDQDDSTYPSSYTDAYSVYLGDYRGANNLAQQNLVVETSNSAFENLKILTNFWGLVLNRTEGMYKLSMRGNESTPSASIDFQKDVVGEIGFEDNTERNKRNSLSASVEDPLSNWEGITVPMYDALYLEQDNNVRRTENVSFNNITNYYCARTWAKRYLDESRYSKELTITVTSRFTDLAPGQLINFTYSRYGWADKVFRIKELTKQSNANIKLVLMEYDANAYTAEGSQPSTGGGGVVIPPTIAAVTRIIWEENPTTDTVNGYLSWELSKASNVAQYIVLWEDGTVNVVPHPNNPNSSRAILTVSGKSAGTYSVKIRAIDSVGNRSRSVDFTFTIVGGSVDLEDIHNLNAYVVNAESADLEIRWSPTYNLDGTVNQDYDLELYEYSELNRFSTLLRAVSVSGTNYTYTKDNNITDHTTNESIVGVYRQIDVRIKPSSSDYWSYLA